MDKGKTNEYCWGRNFDPGGSSLLFAGQVLPDFMPDFWEIFSWPWIVIGIGLFLFVLGAAVGEPGMAVPATIVSGLGGILAYQWYTGDWQSWSYIWALIPGFVGIGIVLMSLLGGDASAERWHHVDVYQLHHAGCLWFFLWRGWTGRKILAGAVDLAGRSLDGQNILY